MYDLLFCLSQSRELKYQLTALQLYSCPAWYWHAVRASGFCLFGLDRWDGTYSVIWIYFLLYVASLR
jgi:hypothetical protein